MKLWTWSLGLFLCLNFIQCKSTDVECSDETTEINYDSIPKYDSIDWSKAFKFKKVNLFQKVSNYRKFNRYFDRVWKRNNLSGGFLVAQNGRIIYENYSGYSDFNAKEKIDAHTAIHIASISKVLTGLAILKLVENDKLKLEDTVNQYLDDFPYPNVTIENLLSHRSGLPNYMYLADDKKYWDKSQIMTNQDMLDMLIEHKPAPISATGRRFHYNNTNYALLALIIEKITQLKYPEAMDLMVFKPLGMNNTFVFEYEKDKNKVSKSYQHNGVEWAYDHLDATYGDKNIYSTPRDLYKMDVAMYSDKFLPKELKEKAWKGYSYETKGVKNYGLGIRLMEWNNGDKILYHNGWWHGNNTVYARDFNNQVTIIALGNKKNRAIYGSFKLVSEFGDYPFNSPLNTGKRKYKREESL